MTGDYHVAPADPQDQREAGQKHGRENDPLDRRARVPEAQVALELFGFQALDLEALVGEIELRAQKGKIGRRRERAALVI